VTRLPEMSANPATGQRSAELQSMPEIDSLLMEEIMMRRNYPMDARTRGLQTLCMLTVLAALGAILIHELTHTDATSIVSVPTLLEAPNRISMAP
jgi:hypothetical protein